jgi:thiol-disulfide isomerase/thioredoxin
MPNPTDRLLYPTLLGGMIFLIAAVGLVIALLREPAPAGPVVTGPVVIAAELPATAPPAPSPTAPPPPTETPTGAARLSGGDKLALSTATPALAPTATRAPTASPQPAAPAQAAAPPAEGLRLGDRAPDFTLGSNRASRVSLSELRGQIVILNFWASWCPPCRHEVPALQSIHNEFGPQGVVVLAVNEGEKLENVERFAWDNDISFTVWLDEDRWAGSIYSVRSIPTTYFIDGEGVIRAIQIGTLSREQIVAQLEKLL